MSLWNKILKVGKKAVKGDLLGAGLAAAGAIVPAVLGSKAAKSAANVQQDAADQAIAEERRQYDQSRADLEPYRQAGSTALGQLGSGTAAGGEFNRSFTLADFNKDPGRQFRIDEGQRALDAGASARGGVLSGAALKATARYGQDYASGEYQNAYNRFNNDTSTRYNRLASLAGIGQTATNSGIAAGQNMTTGVNDAIIGGANSNAAGKIGSANAINSGVQTLGNFYLQSKYGYKPPVKSV